MLKYSFFNDYSEGAHPALMEILFHSNLSQETGYGNDALSLQAAEHIRKTIHHPDADIHFVSGGTQANIVVLSAVLKPHESVIAADSAHIHTHEAGAIEAGGHKINTIASADGKLTPESIQQVVALHTDEHMVKPRVVFISNSTELGTVYSKAELEGLSTTCRNNNLYLYMDGARLGAALTSLHSDLAFDDLKQWVDVYYIGGTKNGALIGEAIVINTPVLKENFRFHMKQHGALLAKGRILGGQFLGLFQDGLYFELARHANAMAGMMAEGISAMGFSFLNVPASNQVFPILPNSIISRLQQLYGFYIWKKIDPIHSAIRMVTSWATQVHHVEMFLRDLGTLSTTG